MHWQMMQVCRNGGRVVGGVELGRRGGGNLDHGDAVPETKQLLSALPFSATAMNGVGADLIKLFNFVRERQLILNLSPYCR